MRQSWLPWSLPNLRKDVNVFCSKIPHPFLQNFFFFAIFRLTVLKCFCFLCTSTFQVFKYHVEPKLVKTAY